MKQITDNRPEDRVTTIVRAIELGVDCDDFRFRSPDERELFEELLADHEARIDKDDVVWLAA